MKECKHEKCGAQIKDEFTYCYDHYQTQQEEKNKLWIDKSKDLIEALDKNTDAIMKLNSNTGAILQIYKKDPETLKKIVEDLESNKTNGGKTK